VSELRAGPLFWVLLLFAAGFARYFFVARRDGDDELAIAAAVAFLLVCVVAAALTGSAPLIRVPFFGRSLTQLNVADEGG
jgi:hypothetical protein